MRTLRVSAIAVCEPGQVAFARRSGVTMHARASDEALAAAFSAKEPSAFEEAYRRFASLLYSTAYNVVGNTEDAQDCVHDALSRVWRAPAAYSRERGALRSFLTVCVRNEAISRVRSQQRCQRLSQRLAAEPEEHDEIHLVDPVEQRRLQRALAALPDEQREPLRLAYFEQKTHTEIARELNEPLGTVKSRISIGLKKLAAAMRVMGR